MFLLVFHGIISPKQSHNNDLHNFYLCDVLEGVLVYGGSGEVVEGQGLVNVLDMDQNLEDAEVVLNRYTLAAVLHTHRRQ